MKMFRFALIGIVLSGILSRIFDWNPGRPLIILLALAEAILLVLLARKLWRFRHLRQAGEGLSWNLVQRALDELLPKVISILVLHELRLSLATARVLLMRKVQTSRNDHTFHPLDGSHYGAIFKLIMLLLISELPLMHVLLNALLHDGPWKSALLIGHAASSLYGLMWLVGDYRLLLESPGIELRPAGMNIELGIRAFGHVPYASIVTAELSHPPEVPPGQSAVKEPETIRLSLHEKPNILITLQDPVTLRLLPGLRKSGRRLRLYVSDTQNFLAVLHGFRASTAGPV